MSEETIFICNRDKLIQVKPCKECKNAQDQQETKSRPSTKQDNESTSQQQETSDLQNKSKKGKFYYTNEEKHLLGKLRKLFKTKSIKRKHPKCLQSCCKQIEKVPSNECRIKVEAWEKHDERKCVGNSPDYKYVGELLFPVCGKQMFPEPGVPIRKSRKSYCVNKKDMFGKTQTENRSTPYSDLILTTPCKC